jgi:hypothetical protein
MLKRRYVFNCPGALKLRNISNGRDLEKVLPLMMEAADTSETSVNFYQIARHDSHLYTCRLENLKSHEGTM